MRPQDAAPARNAPDDVVDALHRRLGRMMSTARLYLESGSAPARAELLAAVNEEYEHPRLPPLPVRPSEAELTHELREILAELEAQAYDAPLMRRVPRIRELVQVGAGVVGARRRRPPA